MSEPIAFASPPPSFRSKTGSAVLTSEHLELSRTGARGALASAVVGSNVHRTLVLYGLFGLLAALRAAYDVAAGSYLVAALWGLVGVLMARGIYKSRGLSAANVISRASIVRIESHPPRPPLARGYFVVHFTEDDRPQKRLIILPGIAQGGSAEYQKALEVFRGEGIAVG